MTDPGDHHRAIAVITMSGIRTRITKITCRPGVGFSTLPGLKPGGLNPMRLTTITTAILFAITAPAYAAPTRTQLCESALEVASAKYVQCRLLAESKDTTKPDPTKLADALGKCSQKLSDAFTKATDKYGTACAPTATSSAFATYLNQCSDDTVAAAAGASLSAGSCNLDGAILKNAYLPGAVLEKAHLQNVDFSVADLSGADLTQANLSGADLASADLSNANLTGANLTGANLAGAYLHFTYLGGANLTNANLSGAIWSGTVCPDGTLSSDHIDPMDPFSYETCCPNMNGNVPASCY
jgi:hypothetical protein